MNEALVLKKTPVYDKHLQLGAKMVSFAGFDMPISYTSVVDEHKTVRNAVGIFDVSHMGEFLLKGPKALELIQKITTNDAAKLHIGQAQYTCMPNDRGGIVDDLLIYKISEENYMLVVNAANIGKDWNWIRQHNQEEVMMQNISDKMALFAVQGPNAIQALQKLTPVNLKDIPFYHFVQGEFGGVSDIMISATGYTGSGGFELYIPSQYACEIWEKILSGGQDFGIKPIGLGARDTLRLEMGYCLYGNDINDHTSPIEAGLGWITKFSKSFINDKALLKEKKEGVKKKLVAFKMLEKGIPRPEYQIFNEKDKKIGQVTSGSQSPSLGIGIGLGYVDAPFHQQDQLIWIAIRNKKIKAQVVKLPFYSNKN